MEVKDTEVSAWIKELGFTPQRGSTNLWYKEYVPILVTTEHFTFFYTELQKAKQETAKAYGGCTDCYGKGFASYSTAHIGRHYYKKVDNPVFCKCDRGKQLEAQVKKVKQAVEREVRAEVLDELESIAPTDYDDCEECSNASCPRHMAALGSKITGGQWRQALRSLREAK
jgi:hypothetical protein